MMRNDIKIVVGCLLGSILISLMFVMIYRYDNERLISLGQVSDYQTSDEYVVIIDDIQLTKLTLSIFGCSVKLGEDINYVNKQYVLIDEENQIIGMNTVVVDRKSATEYYNDGFNYDKSGLNGQCLTKYLDKRTIYKVGMVIKELDGNRYLYISDLVVGGIKE